MNTKYSIQLVKEKTKAQELWFVGYSCLLLGEGQGGGKGIVELKVQPVI